MAKFEKDKYYWWKAAKLYNYADILLKLCPKMPKYEQKCPYSLKIHDYSSKTTISNTFYEFYKFKLCYLALF